MLLHLTQIGFDGVEVASVVTGGHTRASGDDGTLFAIESSENDVSLKLIDCTDAIGVTGAELVKRI